jgi:O-antigen/teichoic acid export membrane protein
MRQAIRDRRIPPGIRQGIILVGAVTFAFALDYGFNLAAGRMLTPAQFSIVVALAAVGQVLVVGSRVIQTVVTRYVSRFLAQEGGEARSMSFFRAMFRAAWRWGAVALVAALILSYPLARFLKIDEIGPVLALALTVLLLVVRPVVGGTLQGRQHFGALGGVQVVQAAARLALGVILIAAGLGAFGAMIALPIASGIALAVGWLALRRWLKRSEAVHHDVTVKDLFRYTSYAAAGLLGFALLINMDAILVRRFFGPEQAGNYSAAVTLGKVIQFFPLAIIMLLFPKAALRRASRLNTAVILAPAMMVVALICGGIALVYFLFGDTLVRLTLGAGYQVDGSLLGLVGLAMLLLSLTNVWLNYFLSTESTFFVYFVGLGIALQAGLMFLFHEALWQLPAAMAANGLWLTLVGLVAFWRGGRNKTPSVA